MQPDIATYNAMMSTMESAPALLELYDKIKADNLTPTIQTYTCLLDALSKIPDVNTMEQLLKGKTYIQLIIYHTMLAI